MFDPKATASHLDLYEGAAVKGFRWRLAILIASWLRIWVRGQVPQPRSGAPTAQDLRVHLISNIIEEIAILFVAHLLICLSFVAIQGKPFACVQRSPHQLISGRVQSRPKVPHAVCEGAGSKGMGPFSTAASFSHIEIRSHIHLGFVSSFYPYLIFVRHPLRTAPRGTRPVSR